MDKYFICLANSYKRGGRCVAGIEISYNSPTNWSIIHNESGAPVWVRPIAPTTYGEIPNITANKIPYFSIVKLTNTVPCPNGIHTEDVNYSRIEVCGSVKPTSDLLDSVVDKTHTDIFYNHGKAIPSDSCFPEAYSLMLIRPENVNIHVDDTWEKPKTRMTITHHGITYDLPITDPIFLDAYRANPTIIQSEDKVYLTISLGLDYEGWHHKLIATVFYDLPDSIEEAASTAFTKINTINRDNESNKVKIITTRIINAHIISSTDGNIYYACNLESGEAFPIKKNVKGFIKHLTGNINCVAFVVDQLNKTNISILNGCKIVVEQRMISANEMFISNTGEQIIKDFDWIATKILSIDVDSIADIIVQKDIDNVKAKGGIINDIFVKFKMKLFGINK
ncbi:MAG: hypothetical protein IKJ78_00610 [Bacteroidales bacterium]|nr:hypothetical protein [Bacteroidales bacterium]